MLRYLRPIERPSQFTCLCAAGRTEINPGFETVWAVHYGEDGPGVELVTDRFTHIDGQGFRLEELQDWAAEEFMDMWMMSCDNDFGLPDWPDEDIPPGTAIFLPADWRTNLLFNPL